MDLNRIKQIIDIEGIDNNLKEDLIIQVLSKDEKVIPTILKIIEQERSHKKELLRDMNLELSRADSWIENNELCNKNFVLKNIFDFYKKNRTIIGNCFRENSYYDLPAYQEKPDKKSIKKHAKGR